MSMIIIQVEACRPYVKYAARLEGLQFAPFHIEKVKSDCKKTINACYCAREICFTMFQITLYVQAVRTSMYGRPGPCYIEVPGDMITDTVDESSIK